MGHEYIVSYLKQVVHPPQKRWVGGWVGGWSALLVLNVLRVKRPLPFLIHPLEMFVEAKLIALSDTPFELADIRFEEPRYSFHPRAFERLASNVQGST